MGTKLIEWIVGDEVTRKSLQAKSIQKNVNNRQCESALFEQAPKRSL